MNRSRNLCAQGSFLIGTLGLWLAAGGTAWAQAEGQPVSGGGSYVAMYAVVILIVGLGVLVVCATSRRREREKPEEYAAGALTKALEAGRQAAAAGAPVPGGPMPGMPMPGMPMPGMPMPGMPMPGMPGGMPGRFAPGGGFVQRGSRPCQEANTALTLAIVGLFCFGPILEPLALIKALQARRMIRDDPSLSGDGTALTALIISSILCVLMALGIIFFIIQAAAGGAG